MILPALPSILNSKTTRIVFSLVVFQLFTIIGLQAQSTVEVSYERDFNNSITDKVQEYSVKVLNLTQKKQAYVLSAALVDCNDGSLKDAKIDFEIRSNSGGVLSNVVVEASSEITFILKTIKSDLETASWSCIEVKLVPEGETSKEEVSLVVKQLNPGNSNSK